MALTITNTNTLTLLNIINRTSKAQSDTLTQLSTGLKINRGADDPAGLIAMESLNAELTAVNAAIDNNLRADGMLNVADGAITEISSLLADIEGMVMSSSSEAGISASERAANQAQIDSAIASIDRIVRTTSFNGKKLLDGNLSIRTTGVDSADISNLRVYSRANTSSNTSVSVNVTGAATTASAGIANFGSGEATSGTATLAVTGTLGTATINVASGATQAQVVTAINAAKDTTGVSATGAAGAIGVNSTGYGSDDFVTVQVLSGGFMDDGATMGSVSRSEGTDATVLVNGQTAAVDGLDVNYNSNGLSLSFSLTSTLNVAGGTSSFTVQAAGGATFQLGTDATTRSTIGIDTLASYNLGGGDSGGFLRELQSGGAADLNTDVATALTVVKKAIGDVASSRGRIGGFQRFQVQTSINSLNATKTGLSDARSIIAETDYATATAELNRQSVLLNSGISLLGLANQQASQILSLLG
ncbi:MAG: flagellin N-terminal helical domain-containing protein [Planctomycetota bacterium]|jgi:flagellin